MNTLNQIRGRFDPVTLGKITRSAELCLQALIVMIVPLLVKETTELVTSGDAFDWRTPLAVAIGIVGTWVVNTAKEWKAGGSYSEPPMPPDGAAA